MSITMSFVIEIEDKTMMSLRSNKQKVFPVAIDFRFQALIIIQAFKISLLLNKYLYDDNL